MNILHPSLRFGAKASAEQIQDLRENYVGNRVHPNMTFTYEPHERKVLGAQIAKPEELEADSLNLRAWKREETRQANASGKQSDAAEQDVVLIFSKTGTDPNKVRKFVGKHFVEPFNQGHSGLASKTLSKTGMMVTGAEDKTIVQIPFQESLMGAVFGAFGQIVKGIDEGMRNPQTPSDAAPKPNLDKSTDN